MQTGFRAETSRTDDELRGGHQSPITGDPHSTLDPTAFPSPGRGSRTGKPNLKKHDFHQEQVVGCLVFPPSVDGYHLRPVSIRDHIRGLFRRVSQSANSKISDVSAHCLTQKVTHRAGCDPSPATHRSDLVGLLIGETSGGLLDFLHGAKKKRGLQIHPGLKFVNRYIRL